MAVMLSLSFFPYLDLADFPVRFSAFPTSNFWSLFGHYPRMFALHSLRYPPSLSQTSRHRRSQDIVRGLSPWYGSLQDRQSLFASDRVR
jgi:hypothetical protein